MRSIRRNDRLHKPRLRITCTRCKPDNIGHTRDLFTLPYFLSALSFALKHILAVLRIITDLPDGKHYDELHIFKWFFFCFAYSEPERSNIPGYKIKVELFTEITYVLQIPVFFFAVKQYAVFSASFAVSLFFRNNANSGFDFGIQGSKL